MKTYLKFLSRHKLYTFINLFGFSVSLMFVLLLGRYVQQQLSVDAFQQNADRIYLFTNISKDQRRLATMSNRTAPQIADLLPEVEAYTRMVHRQVEVHEGTCESSRYKALFADSAFFRMFTFPLRSGLPHTVLSTRFSAVISPSTARRLFGSNDPLGKTFEVDGQEVTVTGVMMNEWPSNSQIGYCDMVLSYHMVEHYWGAEVLTSFDNSSFSCYFMAKPGANLNAKASLLFDTFKQDNWPYRDGYAIGVTFVPLKEVYFGSINAYEMDLRTNNKTQVMLFLAIAGLILVVSMLNYINMSLSQAGFRGKEVATRKLLGSSRARLIWQYLRESILMTAIAFVLGFVLAWWVEPVFNQVLNTHLMLQEVFTPGVVLPALLFVLVIGVVAGAAPALFISQFNPIEVVKGGLSRKIKSTYSKVLITFQYTVAIALLITSTFIVIQTKFMSNYDLGFSKDKIVMLENVMGSNSAAGARSQLQSIAGVEAVSFVGCNPLRTGCNSSFVYQGQSLSFEMFTVDSAFFTMFKIKVAPTGIANTSDTWILNPVGFAALQPDTVSYSVAITPTWTIQVSGVTNDFHFRSLQHAIGCVMLREDNHNEHPGFIMIKLSGTADVMATTEAIRRTYSEVCGYRPFDLRFADDVVQQWYVQETNTSKILMAFTLLTMIILIMGVFAMSLYFIQQKEREIAVRKVHGASEWQLLILLNRLFVPNVAVAFVVATPISYLVVYKWLQGFAYKTPIHWWVFVAAGVGVLLLSTLTIGWQAYKAATANPTQTLKGN